MIKNVAGPEAMIDTPAWYVADVSGQHAGPFTTADLRERARQGRLSQNEYLWKDGLASWTRAAEIGEVFSFSPEQVSHQETSAPTRPESSRGSGVRSIEAAVNRLNSPGFFRLAARISGGLAVLAVVASMVLIFFGFSLLLWAFLLAVMFFVTQGVASIVERLDRLALMLNQGNDEKVSTTVAPR